MASRGIAAATLGVVVSSCAVRDREPETLPEPGICFECFWQYQDPAFREELVAVYRDRRIDDPLVRADVRYLLGRATGDRGEVCGAFSDLKRIDEGRGDSRRALIVAEMIAFSAAECGEEAGPLFRRAARAAREARRPGKARVYEGLADGSFIPEFGENEIRRRLDVPAGATCFVLGRSMIRVRNDEIVAVQVERVARDWISYQMEFYFTSRPLQRDQLVEWHEGARLGDVLAAAAARVDPVEATPAVRRGESWYAPDENGVFRFEVLQDKVRYPTTRVHGAVALLVDTHGISSLVQGAAERDADLVVGCGDAAPKMEAAVHLARIGADVYFPCDRFVGDVIGYEGRGVLIGSAPVSRDGNVAVIGDRPVEFEVAEPIVAQDTSLAGRYQYYDAPARYFRRLAEFAPLRVEYVEVDGPGQSGRIVARARDLEATAVAVRVETEDDAAPVREWLAASEVHRAVLFHSAPYPAGLRLFEEFPGQTTFGDPRPVFLP